jgi:hypothetical protein
VLDRFVHGNANAVPFLVDDDRRAGYVDESWTVPGTRAPGHPVQCSDSTHCASVCASALVSCVLAGIGTLPHTPILPFTIDCAR